MSCIICNGFLLPSQENPETSSPDSLTTVQIKELILESFCNYFQIKLPIGIIHWDLTQESLPFCTTCAPVVERLVMPNRRLKSWKKNLAETEAWVKEQIQKTSRKTLDKNVEGRVQALRDLIVGPCLRLEKIPVALESPPSPEINVIKEEGTDSEDSINNSSGSLPNSVEEDSKARCSKGNVENEELKELSEDVCTTEKDVVFREDKKTEHVDVTLDFANLRDVIQDPGTIEVNKDSVETITIVNIPVASKIIVSESEEPGNRTRRKRKIKSEIGEEEETELTVYRDEAMTVDIVLEDLDDTESGDDDSSDTSEDPPDLMLAEAEAEDSEDTEEQPRRRKKRKPRGPIEKPGPIAPNSRVTYLGDDKYLYARFKFSGNDKDGYKCDECDERRVFALRKNVNRHMLRWHFREGADLEEEGAKPLPLTFPCSQCDKVYTTPYGLKHHMETHDESNSSICEVCGKIFACWRKLRSHVKLVHTLSNGLACEECGKVFKLRGRLTEHKKHVHLKERSVFCEFCGKGFVKMYKLQLHVDAVHSSVRRYYCESCDLKFSQNASLVRHRERFHGKANSESKQELDPEALKKLKLPCKYCSMRYSRHNDLTMHLKRIHNINVKGLNWKSKAPRKVLEKVTPQPDLVVRNACKIERGVELKVSSVEEIGIQEEVTVAGDSVPITITDVSFS